MRRRSTGLIPSLVLIVLLSPAAIGASGGTLVVLNKAEATASLIDVASGKVVATIPTGEGPHEVDVSPSGRLALVTDYGTRNAPGKTLTVIDIPAARVLRTIDLGEYRRPHGVAWLKDGRHAVVTVEDNKALITVDVDEGKVTGAVKTDQDVSHMVAVTPDGTRAFVANIGSGSVSVIDLEKGTLLRQIETGEGAEGIDITPDGKQVWITNRADDTVSVVDAATLETIGSLEVGAFPIRASVTPDGRHVLVSNARSGDIAVIDTAARKEVRRIGMTFEAAGTDGRLFGDTFGTSPVPIGILISPDGATAWVANANADRISVVDLKEWKVTGVLTAGKEPDGLGWSPLAAKAAPEEKGATP